VTQPKNLIIATPSTNMASEGAKCT